MKRVFLTIGMFIFSLNVLAQDRVNQESYNTENLIGWWVANKDFCDMFFWRDIDNNLQVQQISNINGKPFILSEFELYDDSVFIKCTVFSNDSETSSTTLNRYTFINDETIECISTDFDTKEVSLIIYSKIK